MATLLHINQKGILQNALKQLINLNKLLAPRIIHAKMVINNYLYGLDIDVSITILNKVSDF